MTPDQARFLGDVELRVKVALHAGWKFIGQDSWTDPSGYDCQVLYATGECSITGAVVGQSKYENDVPSDYPRCLNAMHGLLLRLTEHAEKGDREQGIHCRDEFLHYLGKVMYGGQATEKDWRFGDMVFASARQLAEAYVLMMEGTK